MNCIVWSKIKNISKGLESEDVKMNFKMHSHSLEVTPNMLKLPQKFQFQDWLNFNWGSKGW